jgi:hypothetical protein
MKKLIGFLILILTLLAAASFAETFNVTYIRTSPISIKASNKDDGKYLWQSLGQVRTVEADGRVMLLATEKCKGIWGNKEKRTWNVESYYIYEGSKITPDHSTLTFYDMDGKIVEKLTKTYSKKDGKLYCVKNNDKKEFDFEDDLIDKEILGTCMMNFPYGREKDFEFHMMTNEPSHYKMTMVNKGTETLKQNGKDVECYKLQMVPDLGMLGFVGAFVPKTYFWYKVAAPHDFVRYEGLESGLNTPYIVMEAQE